MQQLHLSLLPTAPEVVTNEGLVEEAWEIVNDIFLATDGPRTLGR